MNSRERIIAWDKFLGRIRVFLHERGYYETQTNHVVQAGAFEAAIDTFKVTGPGLKAELHTSPEIEMKRVIADSHLSLFQICRCFRDDPETAHHLTEFTMLEYYRVFGTYEGLQEEVCSLLKMLSPSPVSVIRKSVRELLLEHTGIDLYQVQELVAFKEAARAVSSITVSDEDSWQDLFFRIWVSEVETKLAETVHPVLVYDYPMQIAGLAAPHADSPWVVQRFEIYWRGMELCNGAVELRDAALLERRYEAENTLRAKEGKAPHPRPESLFTALGNLPECCGVAIGLERVFAAVHEKTTIRG